MQYRTDEFELPHWSTTCMLWQLFALLGCTAVSLGIATDVIVRLNPATMSFRDLVRIGQRNPSAPMGALTLQRVDVGQWEAHRDRQIDRDR